MWIHCGFVCEGFQKCKLESGGELDMFFRPLENVFKISDDQPELISGGDVSSESSDEDKEFL